MATTTKTTAVDAADYVVWRKMLGVTGVPPYSGADGSGNSTIGEEDYGVWRSRFGQTLPPGSGAAEACRRTSAQLRDYGNIGAHYAHAYVDGRESSEGGMGGSRTFGSPGFAPRVRPGSCQRASNKSRDHGSADALWERGLVSLLSELDREIPLRCDIVSTLTDDVETASVDEDNRQTVDEVFSLSSGHWWKRPGRVASSVSSFRN